MCRSNRHPYCLRRQSEPIAIITDVNQRNLIHTGTLQSNPDSNNRAMNTISDTYQPSRLTMQPPPPPPSPKPAPTFQSRHGRHPPCSANLSAPPLMTGRVRGLTGTLRSAGGVQHRPTVHTNATRRRPGPPTQGPILPRWGRRHVPTMSPLYVPMAPFHRTSGDGCRWRPVSFRRIVSSISRWTGRGCNQGYALWVRSVNQHDIVCIINS